MPGTGVREGVASVARPPDIAMLGRDGELRSALSRLDPRLLPGGLLIEADPGMGKTMLLEAVRRAATQDEGIGARVLGCHPIEPEQRLPFTGLADLLAPVIEDALPELPGPQRRALEVAFLLAEPDELPWDQRTLSVATQSVMRGLVADRPLMLMIDDLQWLDSSSGRVLTYALRRLEGQPVALVAAARSGEDGLPIEMGSIFSEPRLQRIGLGPLDPEVIDAILSSRLDKALPRSTVQHLHRVTEGNPFFAIEIARGLGPDGSWSGPGGTLPVPSSLRQLVTEHLEQLTPAAQEAALITAATSHATTSMVRRIVGEAATSAIDEAVRAGVLELREEPPRGEHLRFVHPIFGTVVYANAPPGRRRGLHRMLASVVTDPEERPRHLALGADGASREVALELDAAARQAYGRGAPEVAAEMSDLARGITPPDEPDERRRRAVDLAEYLFEAGGTESARALLEEAIRELPPGPRRAEALRRLSRIRLQTDNCWAAQDLLFQALEDAGDDVRVRATIARDLGMASAFMGEHAKLGRYAPMALELAGRSGTDPLIGDALGLSVLADAIQGRPVDSTRIEQAISLEDWRERLPVALYPSVIGAVVLESKQRWDEARERLLELIATRTDRGDENSLAYLLCHLARVEFWSGNWAAAHDAGVRSCRSALQTGQEPIRAYGLRITAMVMAHLGMVDEAGASAREAVEVGQRTGSVRAWKESQAVLGFLELSLGNADAADRYLRPIVETDDIRLAFAAAHEVEALIELGELELARRLTSRMSADPRGRRVRWGAILAGRSQGLIAAAEGDLQAGIAHLEAALGEHDRKAASFELARTLLIKGLIHRRAKQKAAARSAIQEAEAIFRRLGARLWLERATAELSRIGGRSPGGGGLTPTEERVADLVAQGRTNREVADALFLSVKTVNANLSRIYHKLGVRSRTELALLRSRRTREDASTGP